MGAADPCAPGLGRADHGRTAAATGSVGSAFAGPTRGRWLGITRLARGVVTIGASRRFAGMGRASGACSGVGCTARRTSSRRSATVGSGAFVGLTSGAGSGRLADLGRTGLARTRGPCRAFMGGASAAGAAAAGATGAGVESTGLTFVGGGSSARRSACCSAAARRTRGTRLERARGLGSRSAADGSSLLGGAGPAVVGHSENRRARGAGRALLGGSSRAAANPGMGRAVRSTA